MDGDPLYVASSLHYASPRVAIPNGIRPVDIKIRGHSVDGSVTLIKSSSWKDIYIQVLRYDPCAFALSEYYSSRGKEADGMDAIGPFSWKFHRKLQDIGAREQASCIRASRILWREALIEPTEENIGKCANDLEDKGSLDIRMQEERTAWTRNEHKITSLLDKY